jgi:hypothetical protein
VPAQCYVYEPPGEREAELWAAPRIATTHVSARFRSNGQLRLITRRRIHRTGLQRIKQTLQLRINRIFRDVEMLAEIKEDTNG